MKGLTDIPGILVGHATDRDAHTGCTAILCEAGAIGGIDIRGSATGSSDWHVLAPDHVADRVHAIVLSGGSAFGLETACGVRNYLSAKGVGFAFGNARVPIVVGAILFDLGLATKRPNREMGEAAAKAATAGDVAEGSLGAGAGATVGKLLGMDRAMKSGIGTASVFLDGPYSGVIVSALAAVNAAGDIIDPKTGEVLAGARVAPSSMVFADATALIQRGGLAALPPMPTMQNTTLVVVATNAKLDKVQTNKLAAHASAGMARTISPAWTVNDGDVTFALSVGDKQCDITALGAAAAEAVAHALVRAVQLAPTVGSLPGLAG
jgi:L-aminopeptidase/D-esterase-like protein